MVVLMPAPSNIEPFELTPVLYQRVATETGVTALAADDVPPPRFSQGACAHGGRGPVRTATTGGTVSLRRIDACRRLGRKSARTQRLTLG